MQQTKSSDVTTATKHETSRRDLVQALGAGAIGLGVSLAGAELVNAAPEPFAMAPATAEVVPFQVKFYPTPIDDLKRRLDRARWPDRETVGDRSQGAPLAEVRSLIDYWRTSYDFDRLGNRLNAFPQYRTQIDGLGIHFLHVRSQHENALPIILTHGWPGSVVEFLKVIGPLTDPTAHGGRAEDAFHVVIPSLPGYGFSDKPNEAGWGLPRIARAWAVLMDRLGYQDWVAQGGDWGAGVTTWMAKQHVAGLRAIHLNLPILFPPPIEGQPSDEEMTSIGQLVEFGNVNSGYAKLQSTRPQTIGYGLHDSPVGQAAWIYEKFSEWTQSSGDPGEVLSRDEMLDNITLYWLTDTATSSARLYAESFASDFSTQILDLPVAVSVFPGEMYRPLKIWGERVFSGLFYWNEVDKGGHFAAFEQPDIFVTELRTALRALR